MTSDRLANHQLYLFLYLDAKWVNAHCKYWRKERWSKKEFSTICLPTYNKKSWKRDLLSFIHPEGVYPPIWDWMGLLTKASHLSAKTSCSSSATRWFLRKRSSPSPSRPLRHREWPPIPQPLLPCNKFRFASWFLAPIWSTSPPPTSFSLPWARPVPKFVEKH